MMVCKFCGQEFTTEKYTAPAVGALGCGTCTAYCTKKCERGRHGAVQGWHFEPCLSCEHNPYNNINGGNQKNERTI